MKKIVCFAAMAAFGVLFIEGCTKQEGIATEVDGFSISVSTPGTKTVFDGDAYTVEWEEDDALGVVIDDGSEAELYKFTKSSGNTFTCADFVPVEGASYTYYVLYPYDEGFTVSDGVSSAVVNISSGTQSDLSVAGHIKTPLYGKATAQGTASPEIALAHAAAVVKINVANRSGAELEVSEVGLVSADESAVMSGTFSVDFETGGLTAAETSNTASSVLLDAEVLANESSADFYVAVAPFAAENLSVKVNGDSFVKSVVENGFDFNAGLVYTTSVAYDAVSLTQTLENADVYAALQNLKVGEVDITASIDGITYYLCPEDGTFKDGEAVAVTRNEAAGKGWTLSAADTYRIVYNAADNTVTMYSSANEFNQPKTVEFWFENNEDDGWLLEKTFLAGNYYFRTNNGWDKWTGKGFNFDPSLADPQVLVSTNKINTGLDKTNLYFNIKVAVSMADDLSIVKTGTSGTNPETTTNNMTFSSKSYALIPASTSEVVYKKDKPEEIDKNVEPFVFGEWMQMRGAVDNSTCWRFPDNTPVDIGKVVIDLRNMKIRFDVAE